MQIAKTSALFRKPICWYDKTVPPLLILVVAIVFISSWLSTHPNTVMADAPLQTGGGKQAELPPTPAPTSTSGASRTSPLVAILVLLAPLIFIAWKSRGLKAPKVTASCCAPVIDENERPFKIYKD